MIYELIWGLRKSDSYCFTVFNPWNLDLRRKLIYFKCVVQFVHNILNIYEWMCPHYFAIMLTKVLLRVLGPFVTDCSYCCIFDFYFCNKTFVIYELFFPSSLIYSLFSLSWCFSTSIPSQIIWPFFFLFFFRVMVTFHMQGGHTRFMTLSGDHI